MNGIVNRLLEQPAVLRTFFVIFWHKNGIPSISLEFYCRILCSIFAAAVATSTWFQLHAEHIELCSE